MSNPFLSVFAPKNDNGFGRMLQELQNFRASFRGNPKAEVENLVKNGQMTQEQLNQLQAMAHQIVDLMH